jgi:hypothetical protein
MSEDSEVYDDDGDYNISSSKFHDEIRRQAIECMDLFFCDKKYWAGGKIPRNKLYTELNILVVMQTSLIDAFDVAYMVLEEKKPQSYKQIDRKGWDVYLCYEVHKQCVRRHIPKCFTGGLLIVYLAICQGVDCFEKLKQYNTSLHGKYSFAL